MKRKRFIKLAMAEGMDKNEAIFSAKCALDTYKSYATAYEAFYHSIRGRYECYMSGHEKRITKHQIKLLHGTGGM